jgi:hypothetical protein
LRFFICLFTYLLLMATPASAAAPIVPFFANVELRLKSDEKLTLSGKTTLPDGTKISALILQANPRKGLYTDAPINYPEEFDVVVQGGGFTSWFPTAYEKGLPAGRYILQIAVLPNQEELLGPKNSSLTGPAVTEDGTGKCYVWETTVDAPELKGHKK